MESCSEETKSIRLACTECRRRKQKCNCDWPCNHCRKRKVPGRCRFHHERRLRDLIKQREIHRSLSDDKAKAPTDQRSDFSDLSYNLLNLIQTTSTDTTQYRLTSTLASKLERALQLLPPRPYLDILVWNFLHHSNLHYYILYPTSFLEEYQEFWTDRAENRLPTLQWTCLLLVVCACATQFLDPSRQQDLERSLRMPVQVLTETYHEAARELGSAFSPSKSHFVHVQYLLLSCYWYKTEARLVESWHVLWDCIREAQELGMHEEHENGPASEFEREMERRVWCILNIWDWQLSSFLSLPSIICRTKRNIRLPNPDLEGGVLSAVVPMKLQSDLIDRLSHRYSIMDDIMAPPDIHEYQQEVDAWVATFPRIYDRDSPDTSMDETLPRIVFHRHYLQILSLAISLRPFKPYMARPLDTDTELRLRNDGAEICLKLVEEVHAFLASLHPMDARFHFILLVTFDAAAFLCSAILQDESLIRTRGEDVSNAISSAVSALSHLSSVSKAAKPFHRLLSQLFQRAVGSLATVPVPKTRVQEAALTTDWLHHPWCRDALTSLIDDPSQLDGPQTPISMNAALAPIGNTATTHGPELHTLPASYDASNFAYCIGDEVLRHYAEVEHLS